MSVKDISQNSAFLPPMSLENSQEMAFQSPFFQEGNWPSQNWWECFSNPELSSLIEESLQNNPTIAAAYQSIQMAKEQVLKTRSSLFPFVFFEGDEDWARLSKNGVDHLLNPSLGLNINQIMLNFAFDYEFDFWGKYRNELKSAQSLRLAQNAEFQAAKIITSTNLAQAYFALKSLMQKKNLYNDLLEVQNNIFELVTLLNMHAMATDIDIATSEQNICDTEKVLAAIDTDIAIGQHLVNVLRAQSPDAPLDLTSSLAPVPESISVPSDLSSDLLIRRPDLVAAILQVEAYAHQTNAAVADFFPRINLKGYLGLDSLGYKHLMNWQSRILGLIPSVHIPIFRAGEIKANLRMKQAEFERAIYEYDQKLLKSLQEVSDALFICENWFEQQQKQQIILDNALLKVDLMDLKTNSGINSKLQFLQEMENLLEREIQETEITMNQYISVVNLIRSLGGGFTENEITTFYERDGSTSSASACE